MANKTFGGNAAANAGKEASFEAPDLSQGFDLPTEEVAQETPVYNEAPATANYFEEVAPAVEPSAPVQEQIKTQEPTRFTRSDYSGSILNYAPGQAYTAVQSIRDNLNAALDAKPLSAEQRAELAPSVETTGASVNDTVGTVEIPSDQNEEQGSNNTLPTNPQASDFDNMTPEQRRKFNDEIDWEREGLDWDIRGDVPTAFPWRNPDGSYRDGFGPDAEEEENVKALLREAWKQPVDQSKPRYNDLTGMWEYPDANGKLDGMTGYEPATVPGNNIGFATDERATAFYEDTGEVYERTNAYREDRAQFDDSDPAVQEAWDQLAEDAAFYGPEDLPTQEHKTASYYSRIQQEYIRGDLPVERPESVQLDAAYRIISDCTGLDVWTQRELINQVIRLNANFFTDSEGNFFYDANGKSNNLIWTNAVVDAAERIRASMERFGHPFGYTELNETKHVGQNVPRFPIAVPDAGLLNALAEASGQSPEAMRENMRKQALSTYKEVCEWTARSNNDGRLRGAYEGSIRAMCNFTGENPFDYGIPEVGKEGDSPFGNYLETQQQIASIVHEPVAQEAADDRTKRAVESWNEIAKQDKSDIRSFLSILRVYRIFGSLPILASAAAEKVAGNAMANVANKGVFALAEASTGRNAKEYAPSRTDYNSISDADGIEAIAAFKALQNVGGRDAVLAFAQTGEDYTMENVTKFVHMAQPKNDSKLNSWATKLSTISDKWMTGDFTVMDKADAKRWLQSFMTLEMQEDGLTIARFRELYENDPKAFFKQAFNSVNGYQALVQSSNLYAARIDPLTQGMKTWLGSHGWSDAALTLVFGSPYLNYAVKAFELWAPGANTISYMLTKKLADTGKISQDVLENQLGGLTEDGLKRCLIYDVTRFGFTGAAALSMFAVVSMLGGMQPPDDENKLLLPWEWKMSVPWSPEPIPVKQSWFMDDLLQWAAPGCVAMGMLQQGYAPGQVWDCFWNGVSDIFGGNKVYGAVASMFQIGDLVSQFSNNEIDFNKLVAKKFAKTVNMMTSPMGVTQFTDMMHNGDLARNASTDINDKYRNNDWERAYNQYALTNPFMAALGNFFSGSSKFGWENSGLVYVADKETEEIAKGNTYESFLKEYGLDDNQEAKDFWCQKLLDHIEGNDIETLVEQGWCIDSDTAYALLDYVGTKIDDLNDQTIAAREAYVNGSISSNQYWQTKAQLDNEKEYAYAAISAVGYDGLLYDKKAYVEVYGEQAVNPTLEGDDRFYNYGSPINSFLPFTSPSTGSIRFRDINKSLDTGVEWGDYRTENLRDNDTAAPGRYLIPNSASLRNEVMGVTGANPAEEKGSATSKAGGGTEADAFNEKAKAMKQAKSQALSDGLDAVGDKKTTSSGWNYGKSSSSGSSSGGSRSYSSGSGSGVASVPKIYSVNGGNLSINNPSNIYLKNPYSVNNQYLSPSVSTQGSSQAYVRRD